MFSEDNINLLSMEKPTVEEVKKTLSTSNDADGMHHDNNLPAIICPDGYLKYRVNGNN
jgi:hypothetical protein